MKSLSNKQLCSFFSRNSFSEMKYPSIKRMNPYWDEVALRPDYHLSPYIQPRPNVDVTYDILR